MENTEQQVTTSEDVTACRVWAVYLVKDKRRPVEVLAAVAEALDDERDDSSAYFGLSTEDCDDCEGSHFADGEVKLAFEQVKPGLYRVTLQGEADGLTLPDITPPLLDGLNTVDAKGRKTDGEADDFGSYTVDALHRKGRNLPPVSF